MRSLILLSLAGALTACDSSRCPPTEEGVSSCSHTEPVQHVPLVADSFTLYVSNQSFELDPVDITVSIDGQVAVTGNFVVEGQHTWVPFDIGLAPGPHTIKITTADLSDVVLEEQFMMDDRKYGVAMFWYYPDGVTYPEPTPPQFSFSVSDDPPAFQ